MPTLASASLEQSILTPSTLLSLWVLDATNIGLSTVYNFYDGTSANFQPIVFNSVTYTPFPIAVEGMGYDGRGSPVRPKLTASNINGFTSSLLLQYQSLIGARIIRRRVFARYIDAANFPGSVNPYGTPDPTAAYPDEVWFINRKIVENQQVVQWELASLFETDGVRLPRRTIQAGVCPFKYRGQDCGYNGPPIADRNNKLFVGGAGTYGLTLVNQGTYNSVTLYNAGDYVTIYSPLPQLANIPLVYVCVTNGTAGISPLSGASQWVADSCPRTILACKLRFPNQALRFGGYPGTAQSPQLVTR